MLALRALAATPHPLAAAAGAGRRVDFGVDVGPSGPGRSRRRRLRRAGARRADPRRGGRARTGAPLAARAVRADAPVRPARESYGHGNRPDIMKQSVLVQDLVSIPAWPQVKLLGNGRVATTKACPPSSCTTRRTGRSTRRRSPTSKRRRADPLLPLAHRRRALRAAPTEGHDAAGAEGPGGAAQTVVYDDGSGDTLDVPLGTTAFVSGEKAFALLSPAQRGWALQNAGALRAAPLRLDAQRARAIERPRVGVRRARAAARRAAALRRRQDHDAAAGLEEPADRQARLAATRLLRRGPDRRRQSRSATWPTCRAHPLRPHAPGHRAGAVYAHRGATATWSSSTTAPCGTASSARCARRDVRVYHQCNLAASEPPLPA